MSFDPDMHRKLLRAVDTQQFHLLPSLFNENAVWVRAGRLLIGRDAIMHFYTVERTLVGVHEIEGIFGGTCIGQFVGREGPELRFTDVIELDDAGRIVRRTTFLDSVRTLIQSAETAASRMLQQLRRRHIDSGQYWGGTATAEAWTILSGHHPMKDGGGLPLDGVDEICVVDIGPGSGRPCVAAIEELGDRVRAIVTVDVSTNMATRAAACIHAATGKEVHSIIADFLLDTDLLRASIDRFAGRKLFLCLGNLVGNFSQREVFSALGRLMRGEDLLLVGTGLFDPDDPARECETLARFFASEINCTFGLAFMKACGANPDYRQVETSWSEDTEETELKVIRAFYVFPEQTVLHVAGQPVLFAKGDRFQFVESRRYPRCGMSDFLSKHGYRTLRARDHGRHGLFLCERA